MGKTRNNSLRMQQAVRSIFEDYRQRQGCLGHVYGEAACGCDNALQMWRGPKGEKGDTGEQGPPGQNAGSFLVSATFVVDPVGQPAGSYLELVLRDENQDLQTIYVNLSELEDVYTGGNGIDITSMVVAAKLGAGLTFDNQGNITSAYQFCDGLDETSNVVKVKLDSSNNILGFAGSGCKGLTATVSLAQAASGVALVLKGANDAVLSTIPLTGGTGITIQKDASGFTWLVDPSDLVSTTTGNNLTISGNKLYVGDGSISYTTSVNGGVFTLTNADGNTSTFTLPTTLQMLSRADMVCEGGNAPYLRLTFKRDNGQNLYQDIDMSCLATAEMSLDISCDDVPLESFEQYGGVSILSSGDITSSSITTTSSTFDVTLRWNDDSYADISLLVGDGTHWNDYRYAGPGNLSDIIAAGTPGVLMTEFSCSPDSGIPCGLKVWMSCVSNGNNSYTFSFVTGEPAVELTADLVSGENRVDMKPLLTKIGGSVVDVPNISPVVITREYDDRPASGFSTDWETYTTESDLCDMRNGLYVLAKTYDDGVLTFYVEGGIPEYFTISMSEVDSSGSYVDTISYRTNYDYFNCVDIDGNISVDALVTTGVVVKGYDTNTNQPVDSALYLKGERVIGENISFDEDTSPGLTIRAYRYAGSEKVLRLGPSCSSDIPLADISPNISLDARCDETVTPGTQELTLDLVSGENRVDLKPLLEHIGGKVSMKSVEVGESTPVTLLTLDSIGNPLSSGWLLDYCSLRVSDSTTLDFSPSSPSDYTAESVSGCFTSEPLRSSGALEDMYMEVMWAYLDSDTMQADATKGVYCFPYNPDYNDDRVMLLSDVLAAGSDGVELLQYDWDTGEPTGNTLRMVVTPNETYGCCSISLKALNTIEKPCLELEPSCDSCIDLSPALNDCVTHVDASFACEGWVSEPPNAVVAIVFYDANGMYLDGYSLDRGANVTTLPISFSSSNVPYAARNYDYFEICIYPNGIGSSYYASDRLRFSDARSAGSVIDLTFRLNIVS